jgi:hypothetical protein
MVTISYEESFPEIWNELTKALHSAKLSADSIGIQLVPFLWIPITTLPTCDMSCLVTLTAADGDQPFVLVAKFEMFTNSFKFANIQLEADEKLIAWSAIPRAFHPNRVF